MKDFNLSGYLKNNRLLKEGVSNDYYAMDLGDFSEEFADEIDSVVDKNNLDYLGRTKGGGGGGADVYWVGGSKADLSNAFKALDSDPDSYEEFFEALLYAPNEFSGLPKNVQAKLAKLGKMGGSKGVADKGGKGKQAGGFSLNESIGGYRDIRPLREEESGVAQEIQGLIDKNDFLKGKVTAKPEDIIEGNNFALLFSEDSAKHIANRHMDKNAPGSLFKSGVNLRDVAKGLLDTDPSEAAGGRVKWLGVDGGSDIGEMGVAKASPEEVNGMQDYTMPDGRKETVKISGGERAATNEVNLITAELGSLGDGRKALSLITMFPGGTEVDGVEIPMDRGEFASKGLYFVVDPSSPLLKKSVNETISRLFLKHLIKKLNENESNEDKVLDYLYGDDIKQTTGVRDFTLCDEDDWEKVKNYIAGKGINGITGKQTFFNDNPDVSEEEFDKYYDEWLDNIADQRGYEDMNQQDMNWDNDDY